jgi:uncharacterized protein (TIGR03382 family)
VTRYGCCQGNIHYWCDPKLVILQESCATLPQCGWDPVKGAYGCGTSGGADPSGINPMPCPTSMPDGAISIEGGPKPTDGGGVKKDTAGPTGDRGRTDLAASGDSKARDLAALDGTRKDTGRGERGAFDALPGVDLWTPKPPKLEEGCDCSAAGSGPAAPLLLVALLALRRSRARSRRS